MQIITSSLLQKNNKVICGLSTKVGLSRSGPFYFNLSTTVGDNQENVIENRKAFFNAIGINYNQVVYQKQTHSDIITVTDKPGYVGESDALITSKKGIALAISTADCTPIFIYDEKKEIIAAVHSGWRGTEKKILQKTLIKLQQDFNSSANDLIAFIGPAISQKNYEVGIEVAEKFENKYVQEHLNKYYLDIVSANLDMLLNFGINVKQIEVSELCTYKEEYLHSYRRDGNKSGRALGIIAMKEN